jgi:LysM repeat protein
MKKIVPFKKDLMFKTDVLEIISISLEHTLSIKDLSLISGNFLISGDYRVTENSTSLEKFSYEVPFEIHMDEKYILNNATIDIDDFYYEIINNKVLSVSIDVCIDKLDEKKIEEKIEVREEMIESTKEVGKDLQEVEKVQEEKVEKIEQKEENKSSSKRGEVMDKIEEKERCIELEDTPLTSIKNTNTEIYKSYKVYIVREGDTIESILDKYGMTRSDLEDYNDLTNIAINDKILIPFVNEKVA